MGQLKVLHVVTTLGVGGAEMMLVRLVARPSSVQHEIVCLTGGSLTSVLEAAGIRVTNLGLRRGRPSLAGLLRLRRAIARSRPDVVQTWMYHADLAGGLAARLAASPPVVWGVHHTTMDAATTAFLTRVVRWVCTRASGYLPARIVCCAEASRVYHERLGYAQARLIVIPNGVDTEINQPNEEAGAAVRQALGFAADDLVVALIARFHRDKDHESFVRAAGLVAQVLPSARFLLCGENVDEQNIFLRRWLAEEQIASRTLLLGRRADVPSLLAGVDVVASSSRSEAMPLVLGEALACGKLCVATDVGDSALLVGSAGRVVPPSRPDLLAAALVEILSLPRAGREALGATGRAHILANYGLDSVAAQYEAVWREAVRTRGRG